MTTETVLKEVLALRKKQDKKFGPSHDNALSRDYWYNQILKNSTWSLTLRDEYRKRLIIVAALAVAAIEAFNRKAKSQG